MYLFAKIISFIFVFQLFILGKTFSQNKYDETWIFKAQLKEGYSLFTLILEKNNQQQYTKGHIFRYQKKIPLDSILPFKGGVNLYFRDANGIQSVFECNMMGSIIIGTWTRFEGIDKITSPIDASLEPYSNYVENTKKYYNNTHLKGRWEVVFEDNTKGMLVFDNYEMDNIVIARIYTPFLEYEYLEGYFFMNNPKDTTEKGYLYLFGFNGQQAITIKAESDSTKNHLSGTFISTTHKLNFGAKRNADFWFRKEKK